MLARFTNSRTYPAATGTDPRAKVADPAVGLTLFSKARFPNWFKPPLVNSTENVGSVAAPVHTRVTRPLAFQLVGVVMTKVARARGRVAKRAAAAAKNFMFAIGRIRGIGGEISDSWALG